jgi:hypothetical protein
MDISSKGQNKILPRQWGIQQEGKIEKIEKQN